MSRLTQRQLLAALARAGFETKRIKGSHHYLVHKDDASRRTTVAMHSGDLPTTIARVGGFGPPAGDGISSLRVPRYTQEKIPDARHAGDASGLPLASAGQTVGGQGERPTRLKTHT